MARFRMMGAAPCRTMIATLLSAGVGLSASACAGEGGEAGSDDRQEVRHAFGVYALDPGQEIDDLCVSWTLDNEEPLYVQAATLSNDGFWHHSNWTVVPDDLYDGPDGYWPCRNRNFNQVIAAIRGTVLMAQSTQSIFEEQRFPEGLVVKLPPRARIVAGIHFLNTTGRPVETDMRMALELTHPRNVTGIMRPFHLDNRLLEIPPRSERRFRMDCNLTDAYERVTDKPLDLDIRYVLPHFHQRANAWRLEISGGPRDGEVIHEVYGFNSDANGLAFDPPLSLSGAEGLRMTCGYRNPTSQTLTWGVGENEMCEMLGLATGDALVDVAVNLEAGATMTMEDGIEMHTANRCIVTVIPPAAGQDLPGDEEIAGSLYVPPVDDPGVDVTPECLDTPADAEPDVPPTLANIGQDVFEAGCAHNVCHGGPNPQKGLSLAVDPDDPADVAALRARLLDHVVSHPEVTIPLVDPGNAEGSYLYRVLSRCQPALDFGLDGATAPKMPVLQPELIDSALVARVRDWIDAGAPVD